MAYDPICLEVFKNPLSGAGGWLRRRCTIASACNRASVCPARR